MMEYGGSDAVWGPGHGYEKTYSFLLGLCANSFLVPVPISTSICIRSTTILRRLGHTQARGDHVVAMCQTASQLTTIQVILANVLEGMWLP